VSSQWWLSWACFSYRLVLVLLRSRISDCVAPLLPVNPLVYHGRRGPLSPLFCFPASRPRISPEWIPRPGALSLRTGGVVGFFPPPNLSLTTESCVLLKLAGPRSTQSPDFSCIIGTIAPLLLFYAQLLDRSFTPPAVSNRLSRPDLTLSFL